MKILAIDTSGKIASVALCDAENCYVSNTVLTNLTHSQIILPLVENLLKDAEISLADIDAFAVATGPGSYTGLRIGVSAVKGMAFAKEKPCFSVSTLHSLAFNVQAFDGLIYAVMFARQNLVYFAKFISKNQAVTRLCDDYIADISEVLDEIKNAQEKVILVGDFACDLYKMQGKPDVFLAPVSQRLQNASSLCAVAFAENNQLNPRDLQVEYLQITKAEKDLEKKN